jgi:DNA invertase Pin-like site-specific DNA recombinase
MGASVKVAIYSRVSTDSQILDNQTIQLRRFACTQGWDIVREFHESSSGASSNRSAFKEMFISASKRHFDVLLFWSLDRFSREGVTKTLQYLQQLESYGVAFRSFTEPYLDSLGVFKEAILALLASLAKQERIRISERTKAGLERARSRGIRLGRRPCSNEIVQKVREFRLRGKSFGFISRELGIGKATAHRLATVGTAV